jgi:cytochrome c553
MSAKSWSGIWFATMALLVASAAQAADAQAAVDFNRQIRPILSEACYQCHGPDVNKRKANLRLDMRAGLFQSCRRPATARSSMPTRST